MAFDKQNINLSVLILSLPSRFHLLTPLLEKLSRQIGDRQDVEVLTLIDNKSLSIGEKRQSLLDMARGKYVAFLDDDDDVSDTYILSIREAIQNNPANVITFLQHCNVNGKEFFVEFKMGNPHEGLKVDKDGNLGNIKRPPYHMCVWLAAIAKHTKFRDISYAEDIDWCLRMYPSIKTENHIPAVLHHYRYSDKTSESIQYANNPS